MTGTSQEGGKLWYLRQVDLFRGLSEHELDELDQTVEILRFQPGQQIIGPEAKAERVYIIKSGTVRLFHRGPDGREITVDVLGPGRPFGVSALFGPSGGRLLAEAATEAVVCTGEGIRFLGVMAQHPRIALNLITQLGAQVLQTEQQLAQFNSSDARERLAVALYRLVRDAGEPQPGGGYALPKGMSQRSLAQQVGASRETVTRLIASLVQEGYIRRAGRRLIIADVEKLASDFEINHENQEK